MSGQKQSKEAQAKNHIQTKKKPATELGPIGAQSNVEGVAEPLFTSVTDASIQRQADQLSDPRFPREGQQRLARQMGKIGGNQHLQRVMVQMRRAKPAPAKLETGLEEKEPSPTSALAPELSHLGPAGDNPIQRTWGGSPNYEPKVSIEPRIRSAVLNQEVDFKVQVMNKRQAPRGTEFQWDWGGRDADKVEAVGLKPPPGPRAILKGKIKRAADTRVDGGVVATGPNLLTSAQTDPAQIAVEKPTGKWAIEHWDTEGNVSPKIDRVGVGDMIIIRLELDNITAPETLNPKIFLPAGALASNGKGTWKGNIYELELRALKPALVNPQVLLQFPGYDQPFVSPVEMTSIEMNKQEFINFCSQANTKVDNAYKKAKMWMLDLCIAYGNAYKTHTDTLSGVAEKNRLIGSLLLGAALAFVPGGIGGAIGGFMKSKMAEGVATDFMIDGVKDLAKWGMRIPTMTGVITPSNSLQAFPPDPLQWRNHVEKNVEAESLAVGQILESWQHKTNQNDPNFYRNFDPVEKVAEALTIAGTKVEELPAIDRKTTADDFERGMWTAWLEQFGYVTMEQLNILGGQDMKLMRNIDKDIEERCNELGIDIEKYAAKAKKAAEKKIDAHYEEKYTRWRNTFRQLSGGSL